MNLILDFRKKRPICEQIRDGLREQIREKQLLPGEQLPAVRDLAAELKINFNTVARAYRELDREGWISTQQGRGTFVLDLADGQAAPEEAVPEHDVEQQIDRFLSEIHALGIAEESLWDALGQRIIARQTGLASMAKRKARKVSRKPVVHLSGQARQAATINRNKKVMRRGTR
jgi:GntR family transcriptional regulator